MPRETYVLRFHRPAGDIDAEAPTTAPGLTVTTRLEGGAFTSEIKEIAGESAGLELEYRLNKDGTQFFEWGTVRFGDAAASTLSFSSIGTGSLAATPDGDGFSHGTVMYSVDGGSGRLDGAGGAITSNFLINLDTNELIDTHLGIIRLP